VRSAPARHPDDPGAPLERSIAAVRERLGGHDLLALRIGRPAGWLDAPGLATSPSDLDDLLRRTGAGLGTDRADVAAMRLAEAYAWALAMRAVAILLVAGRVPAMGARSCRLEASGPNGDITAVAVGGRCWVLPGDPLVAHASADPVADEDALLQRIGGDMREHLDLLLAPLASLSGRPVRALWRGAGDRLAGAFLWLGEMLGERDRAWALGVRCLRMAGPLDAGAGFRVLEHAGIAEPTRNRRSCCLLYRVAGAQTCFTCPLTTEEERRRRLAARARTGS
jgi:FhuF 2Fe-2S C-terminal domain